MIVRFDTDSAAPRAKRAQGRRAIRATVAAASFLFCGLAAAQGGASAAQGAAASGASAASSAAAALSIAGQYTVHPGQSLHDVAVDVTQSHDKGTLARMSQALFDANPNAFIKQDPSRMRVGAALNVPATPDLSSAAEGMTAASGGAASASAGASAAASAPATATAAPASTPAAASSAAAEAVAAASSAAAAATGGASSAGAAATAAATASAAAASGPEAAAQGASGAAAVGASAAVAASAASDSHVWSGSIQAPASGAAGASAQGAKGAPVTVSSLQQLLALKNRVLMALQQHGIGKPAQTAGGASAGAPAAQGGAPVQNGAANAGPAGGQPEVSPIAMGAVAAIVVALLALFVRLLMRKRKKPAEQATEVSPEAHEPTPSASAAAAVAAAPVAEEPPVLHEPISRAGDEPAVNEAAPVEEAEFVPPVAPAEPAADEVAITPVPTPAVTAAPLEHDEALPPMLTETLHPATPQAPSAAQEAHAAHELPHGVEPGEPQTLADATDAASLAAAVELGADALPPESLGAPRAAEDAEALARTLEEPSRAEKPATPDIALDFGNGAPQAAQPQQAAQAPQAEPAAVQTPPITEAFERPPAPLTAPEIPSVPAVTAEDMSYAEVPIAFPHDAIEALGGLDLPLPPRIGEPVMPTAPLSTEPAATPEASARLASPFFEPPAPLAGQAIEAGTAGAGALAGLGAPRFGALTLDFDLNLPPDSAEPLPVFTPEQLARIARNKLDLAHEYIALGDVSGARSLINEVIESNDPATRSDAQALLSTLAPLS